MFSSPLACEDFPWITFSPNHSPTALWLFCYWPLRSTAGAWTAHHMCSPHRCWLCVYISAAPGYLDEASLYMGKSPSCGLCLHLICKHHLAWDPLNNFFHLTHGMPMNTLRLGLLQSFSHFTRNVSLKCCIWSKWLTLRLGIHSWYFRKSTLNFFLCVYISFHSLSIALPPVTFASSANKLRFALLNSFQSYW